MEHFTAGLAITVSFSIQLALKLVLLHRADETQPGRDSCPRLQSLAFSLDSIIIVVALIIFST